MQAIGQEMHACLNFEDALHMMVEICRYNSSRNFFIWKLRYVSNTVWENSIISEDHCKNYYKKD